MQMSFGRIAFAAQEILPRAILPIFTHFSVVWSVMSVVCHIRSPCMLKLFDGWHLGR